MSVHLRSNGSASQNVFIGSDISQGTTTHKASAETRAITSKAISRPLQNLECLPQQQKQIGRSGRQSHQVQNTTQAFQKYDNNSDATKNSQSQQRVPLESIVCTNVQNQQSQHEIYPRSSELHEDVSVNGGASALPSAPVHLQETVDSLLTTPAIGPYGQSVIHDSGPEGRIHPSIYPITTQPVQKQVIMQQFGEIPVEIQESIDGINDQQTQSMCGCPPISDQSAAHSLGYCPNTPKPQSEVASREGCTPSSQKISQSYPVQEQQNNVRYNIVRQADSRKQTQSKQQQTGMSYSMSPQLHLVSAQQQQSYYVPMSSYNPQSILMVQLDYQQQHRLRTSPIQPTTQSQKTNNASISSPVLYENGSWDEYAQLQARGFQQQQQNNNFDCMQQPQQQPQQSRQYQAVKKRRRRTSQRELEILENHFKINTLPSYTQREQLARDTGMTPRSVQVWFQNKRQSLKKRNMSGPNTKNSDRNRYYAHNQYANVQPDKKVPFNMNEVSRDQQDSKKLQSPPPEVVPQISKIHDQPMQSDEGSSSIA